MLFWEYRHLIPEFQTTQFAQLQLWQLHSSNHNGMLVDSCIIWMLKWLHVQVIEKPDPSQQGKTKPTIRNVFSEVTPEIDMPHVGPTNPPSAAAAKVIKLP